MEIDVIELSRLHRKIARLEILADSVQTEHELLQELCDKSGIERPTDRQGYSGPHTAVSLVYEVLKARKATKDVEDAAMDEITILENRVKDVEHVSALYKNAQQLSAIAAETAYQAMCKAHDDCQVLMERNTTLQQTVEVAAEQAVVLHSDLTQLEQKITAYFQKNP